MGPRHDLLRDILPSLVWISNSDLGKESFRISGRQGEATSPPRPTPKTPGQPPTGKQVGGCQKPHEFYCQPIQLILYSLPWPPPQETLDLTEQSRTSQCPSLPHRCPTSSPQVTGCTSWGPGPPSSTHPAHLWLVCLISGGRAQIQWVEPG